MKRSRFIAFLLPLVGFEGVGNRLKNEHPKASHLPYAYRYINKYDQTVERSSDDGEPKGCAGQPILKVMRSAELVECGILVVRYFGGIKLGTGGMVRAYAEAAKAVVESAALRPFERRELFAISAEYARQRPIEYLLQKHGITVRERIFENSGVLWSLEATSEGFEAFAKEADRLIRVRKEEG